MSNQVLPLDVDPEQPADPEKAGDEAGDPDAEKLEPSASKADGAGGDQDVENPRSTLTQALAESEIPEDAAGDQPGQELEPDEPPPRPRIWWGDLVPRPDGTYRTTPRLSDVEFVSDRGQWSHMAEFILSCMGMSVGLGNVWRFPYLAYKNGGAAFLLAYVILQLLVGEAMYFMELTLTQFSGKGPTKMWDMFPAGKGIGIAMCFISANIATYYNVVMCYTIYYLFSSFQSTLPWNVCEEEWENCVAHRYPRCTLDWGSDDGMCTCSGNATIDTTIPLDCAPFVPNAVTAANLYFYKSVIQISSGLEPSNLGTPIPKLTLCLLLSWLIVVFCLARGIKSSGKIVYFTVTFPYVILLALLIRSSFLDGALEGVEYFIVPTWSKLKDVNVWGAAAGQMFFSLSVALGGIIMFGSYNKFTYPVYKGALIVASMDLLTSFVGGLVVFTTFGAMAKSIGSTVENIAISGYGLAFIIYPEALSNMPFTHVWSILFFLMLFTLGLDSEFGLCETSLTSLYDEFPKLRNKKTLICLIMGLTGFLLALPCVCPGGDYVVTLMDHYGADFAVVFLAFCEVLAIMWGYGADNVLKDLDYMLGGRPFLWQYWYFCWILTCPLILLYLFVNRMVHYVPPKYANGESYPIYAQALGWILAAGMLSPIPIYFFYLLKKSYKEPDIKTWEERKSFLFAPNRNWIPNDGRAEII